MKILLQILNGIGEVIPIESNKWNPLYEMDFLFLSQGFSDTKFTNGQVLTVASLLSPASPFGRFQCQGTTRSDLVCRMMKPKSWLDSQNSQWIRNLIRISHFRFTSGQTSEQKLISGIFYPVLIAIRDYISENSLLTEICRKARQLLNIWTIAEFLKSENSESSSLLILKWKEIRHFSHWHFLFQCLFWPLLHLLASFYPVSTRNDYSRPIFRFITLFQLTLEKRWDFK